MVLAEKMLPGPSAFWLTGWRAVSPGHAPFCARASISVPGAPASSLLTGSQPLVSNPGTEICAPVWVATALLRTCQPPAPRSVTSLAPVPGCAAPAVPGAAAMALVAAVAGTTSSPIAREIIATAVLIVRAGLPLMISSYTFRTIASRTRPAWTRSRADDAADAGGSGDVVALGEQPAEFQNFLMSVLMAASGRRAGGRAREAAARPGADSGRAGPFHGHAGRRGGERGAAVHPGRPSRRCCCRRDLCRTGSARRAFSAGLAVFVLASAVCGLGRLGARWSRPGSARARAPR